MLITVTRRKWLRLLWALHHLIVDGQALRILLDDLAALAAGRPLPPAASFAACCRRLDAALGGDRLAQLLAYWDQRSASKGEGASGSDMARKAAGLDCDNRRYGDGIKRMEDLLRQNRYPVPAPQ